MAFRMVPKEIKRIAKDREAVKRQDSLRIPILQVVFSVLRRSDSKRVNKLCQELPRLEEMVRPQSFMESYSSSMASSTS